MFFSFQIQDDDKEQSVEMCLHEVDTECEWERQSDHHCEHTAHPEKVRTENCLQAAQRFLSVLLPRHRNTSVPGHTYVLLVSHETWMTWKRTNLRTSLARLPKTSTRHDALKYVSGTEDDQAEQHDHGTIERSSGRLVDGTRRRCSGRSRA